MALVIGTYGRLELHHPELFDSVPQPHLPQFEHLQRACTQVHGQLAQEQMQQLQQTREELRRSRDELRQTQLALRQAQAELARMARVTTMGEMAASIAHEVSQPLSAIVLNAGAGLRWLKHDAPDLEQVRQAFEQIVGAGKRAGEIVRGISGLARKTGPALAEFAVDDALREVLLLLRSELQKKGIAMRTEFGLQRQTIRADRAQFQQVVLNLMVNAMDAIAAGDAGAGVGVGGDGDGGGGGGTTPYTCATARREIRLRSAAIVRAGDIQLSVEDSGAGLAPELAARVFDPLFSTKPQGMGMGLAICRSIVEAHGGRIWATPGLRQGAAFHFSLPRGDRTDDNADRADRAIGGSFSADCR